MLDKFGLPTNFPRTPGEIKDIQNALSEVESFKTQWSTDGFNVGEIEEFANSFVKNKVIDGLKSRVADASSALTPAEPGATLESEAIHVTSVGDVRREEKYQEKIPLSKVQDAVTSATKGMQINIENVSNKINKILESYGNYADMASRPELDIEKLIEDAASVNSKYMKTIMNKMMEFTNKTVNKELSAAISSMPASKRAMFADMKNLMNQNSLQSFGDISNGMQGMLAGILKQSFNVDSLIQQAQQKALNPITPMSSLMNVKDWIPSMPVTKGEKIRFRNNIYTAEKSGNTGTTLPIERDGSQQSGNTTLKFDSFVEGDGSDVKYGDVGTYPKVPICYAENIIGQALGANKKAIDQATSNVIDGVNSFIGDIQSELDEMDKKMEPKAFDNSGEGKVIGFSDEEGGGNVQGGSYYITGDNIGVTGSGTVTPVGVASTAPGPGNGLTVDITVSNGGATGTTEGELYIKILDGGSGYNTGGGTPSNTGTNTDESTTGGSGTGCLANITYSGGIGTKVTITEGSGGTNYIAGDILTVTGSNGGSGCTFEIIKPRGRIDSVIGSTPGIVVNNPGQGYRVGELVTVFRETYNSVAPDATFTITSVSDPGPVKMEAPKSGKNKPQSMGSMLSKIGNIGGSLTSALNFKNITSNIFPFELPPVPAMSDFYTLARGSGAMPDGEMPSMKSIGDAAAKQFPTPPIKDPLSFVQPAKDALDVIQDSNLDDVINASQAELDEAFDMF
tara:strand:+ start:100 stop:2307 length:2208 start_codon:yes stop_codon:yes gene_type:complete